MKLTAKQAELIKNQCPYVLNQKDLDEHLTKVKGYANADYKTTEYYLSHPIDLIKAAFKAGKEGKELSLDKYTSPTSNSFHTTTPQEELKILVEKTAKEAKMAYMENLKTNQTVWLKEFLQNQLLIKEQENQSLQDKKRDNLLTNIVDQLFL